MCIITFPLSHFWKHFPVNCGPLSDTRAAGKPHLLKMLVSWLIITLEVVVRRGMASGHTVARFIQVSRNLKPPVAVGKGSTRSMATLSAGTETSSLSCMVHFFGNNLSIFWQTSQLLIRAKQSTLMVGQVV